MDDVEIILCNTCEDLVCLRTMEAFPLALLGTSGQASGFVSVNSA
jgi:hypothetical protein